MSCFYGLVFLFYCLMHYSSASDKITATHFLKDPETIVSPNGVFQLGFFSPAANSTHRYVGIWYSQVPDTVVWVADTNTNTDTNNTLNNNTSGGSVIRVSEFGTLQVINSRNETLWTSNNNNDDGQTNTPSVPKRFDHVTAQLRNSGNLVLKGQNDDTILWQSFDQPTDTALPNMELTVTRDSNSNTNYSGIKEMLHSWSGPSDPSYGRFSFGIDSFTFPQLVIWDSHKSRPHWRSGPWNGNTFNGIQQINKQSDYQGLTKGAAAGFTLSKVVEGAISVTYTCTKSIEESCLLTNYELSYDGKLNRRVWDKSSKKWQGLWSAPAMGCDEYGKCGAFGICDPNRVNYCDCLKGFEPKNELEWRKGNWVDGCVRKKPVQCASVSGTGGESKDGFFRVRAVKVPDQADWLLPLTGLDQDECRHQCLNNCLCLAYTYGTGIGCMSWGRDLIDVVALAGVGLDLYIRLAHSELGGNSREKAISAVVVSLVAAASVLFLVLMLWRKNVVKQAKRIRRERSAASDVFQLDESQFRVEEVPVVDFVKLVMATDNFRDSNKLGRGGFGTVYRGTLEDGQEIAVKRLSRSSGQGLEEFINEVNLISKLQHRNLVRLLGCCAERDEKMLIYEYMPNKSLDLLLFDPVKRAQLPWKTRCNIIRGICQGILYLHRDSRLKIIHRDLKASNILIDGELTPKISDFGMARILGGKQDQDDTIRIVGTYGYMSPEYAMEGRFSEKSDIFSFGVLLLEIVSGKKNSLFRSDENSLSLLGYAYKLWSEKDINSFIDPVIPKTSCTDEIQKFIQVGLLCVQESPKDRPSISTVISILHSDIADPVHPKEPGFAHYQKSSHVCSTSEQGEQSSMDQIFSSM